MKETTADMEPVIKLLQEIKSKLDNLTAPGEYYRNKHLKSIFGLSDNTIITYRDKNILPFTKLGEIYYYPISEIQNLFHQNSNYDLFGNKF
jgi:hypothetical protein